MYSGSLGNSGRRVRSGRSRRLPGRAPGVEEPIRIGDVHKSAIDRLDRLLKLVCVARALHPLLRVLEAIERLRVFVFARSAGRGHRARDVERLDLLGELGQVPVCPDMGVRQLLAAPMRCVPGATQASTADHRADQHEDRGDRQDRDQDASLPPPVAAEPALPEEAPVR